MSTWDMPSVEAQPHVKLERWKVYRFTRGEERWDILIGWSINDWCGRASTPVVAFDPTTATARTRSGRVYRLIGPPGFNADALYTFQARFGSDVPTGWCREERADDYWQQIQDAGRHLIP